MFWRRGEAAQERINALLFNRRRRGRGWQWIAIGLLVFVAWVSLSGEDKGDRLKSAGANERPPVVHSKTTSAPSKFWVTSERLNRRTCPDTRCGIVGRFFFREGVDIHERIGNWARVTKYYSAACENGRNAYVDEGDDICSSANGVEDGLFAEWVSADFLSASIPADPAKSATQYETLVSQSDDFGRYRSVFAAAAHKLIAEGTCAERDFVEFGGWVKSSNYPNRAIYFAYCGGMTLKNRLYLDGSTGRVSRTP